MLADLNLNHLNNSPEQEDMSLSRRLSLINLDELFAATPGARIVNNETLVSQKLSKEFTDAVYSNSDGELGFVPTCPCGATRGALKEGMPCPKCGGICSSQFIDALSHISWIGIPESMAPVLHPIWYLILKSWTSIGRKDVSVIDIILNPELEVPDDLQPFIQGRGFWYFYEHADEILDILRYKYPRTMKKTQAAEIEKFRAEYRDCMFTRKLPILHNSLHPLKCNGDTLNYVDSTSKEILSAIIDLSTETFKQHATTVTFRQQNKTIFEVYSKIVAYYKSLIEEKLGGKQAMLRKHCFGSRIHFSFRSVVTPQSVALPMDEVLLPWGMMVNALKLPIMNHLMNRHHKSFVEALCLFMESLIKYNALIDKVITTIIAEYPGGRMPILLGRNPE